MMNRKITYLTCVLSSLTLFQSCTSPSEQQTHRETEVITNHKPNQPIIFPHAPHAGIQGIDCKYCHHSALNSREDKRPNADICLNCHRIDRENLGKENKTRLDKITLFIQDSVKN